MMEIDYAGIFEEWTTYAKKKELSKRDIDIKKIKETAKMKIVAVSGMRRSGKTSLLILIHNSLKDKEKTAYINLEDNRIKDNPEILDEILKWFGDEGYLFLDEITSVKNWEGWLSRTHEMLKGKLKIIISSSRSSLATPTKPLRGRIIIQELYPLSMKEYMEFKKIIIEKTTVGKGEIERTLKEYLKYGGFPEVALTVETAGKIEIINSYFKDIIGLDIADMSKENISTVELFAKYVIEGQYFSASKCLNFFKSLGYKIAKQTILKIEKYSQESYLLFFIPIFSKTIKDRTQYPRKTYPGDTGLYYAIAGKEDKGRLYENAIFLELKRKMPKNTEINYWKNKKGQEVDFIIREGLRAKEIIQACYELKEDKTIEREVQSLMECAKENNLKQGIIITKNLEKQEKHDGITIKYVPLWKWLLEPN